MENKQQDTPKQESTNPDTPPLSTERENAENKVNPTSKTTDSGTPQSEPRNLIIKVESTQKDRWTIGNRIAAVSVLVSAILFFYTFRLFEQSKIQSKAATDASIAAGRAVDEYKISNKTAYSNYQLAKKVADNADSGSERNYRLQAKSINAQIQSLVDAKIELEKENRPLIQMADVRLIDSIIEGGNIKIAYNMIDLGKFPAKVLSMRANTFTNPTDTTSLINNVINNLPFKTLNAFAFNQFFIPGSINSLTRFTKSESSEIKNGKRFIYFFGEIRYSGVLNKQEFINRFIYRITIYPLLDISAIENSDSVIHRK